MKRPPCVRIGNLADHAKPLGGAVNRILWRWSPWHLRYHQWSTAQDLRAELREAGRRAFDAEAAQAQMREYVTEHYPPSKFTVPPPSVMVDAWEDCAAATRTYSLRSREVRFTLSWESMLRRFGEWPHVKRLVEDEMARLWADAARSALADLIGQARGRA